MLARKYWPVFFISVLVTGCNSLDSPKDLVKTSKGGPFVMADGLYYTAGYIYNRYQNGEVALIITARSPPNNVPLDGKRLERGWYIIDIDRAIYKEKAPKKKLAHDDIYAIYKKHMKIHLESKEAQKQNMQNKKMFEKLFKNNTNNAVR
jgi:hypothetical protein